MRRSTLMKGMLGVVAVCVAFGVSSLDVKPAAAADNFVLTEYLETSFMMDLGGSVRLKSETKEVTDENGNATTETVETNGLRFSASLSTDAVTALQAIEDVKFGVIIAPADAVTSAKGGLTAENIFGNNPTYTIWKAGDVYDNSMLYHVNTSLKDVDNDGDIEIAGSIVNLATWNLIRDYIGRAYVAIPNAAAEGEAVTYTYYFSKYYSEAETYVEEDAVKNNTRCMYYVAQKAIENGENAATLKTKYIDEYATYTFPNDDLPVVEKYQFPYTVVYHYINGEEEVVETEVKGAALNSTITVGAYHDTREHEGLTYEFDANRTDSTGTIYPSGLTQLHAYYYVKNAGVDNSLSGILSRDNASSAYFDGSLVVTTDKTTGAITLTTEGTEHQEGMLGDMKDNVLLTPEFLYTLQQAGYTKLTIGKISCSGILAGWNDVTAITLSGYHSIKITDLTNGMENLVIPLDKKIYKVGDGYYYDEAGTQAATGVTIKANKAWGYSAGSDWTLTDIRLE